MKNEMRLAYNATINNINFSESNGNKISTTTAKIPMDLIDADPRYQRIDTSSERKIKQLAAEWDDAMCDPIRVVAHPEEYKFYLIDGWHRYSAAKLLNHDDMEAKIIITSMSKEERTRFEAKLFLRQGDNKETLKPAQMHNGRVLIGDEKALLVEEFCERDDIEIVPGRGNKDARTLGNYTKAYTCAKRGRECIEFVFDVIKYSGFNLEPNGYAGYLFETFRGFYIGYGNTVSAKQVGDFLRDMNIITFRSRAIAKYPESSGNYGVRAMIMYLQDYAVNTLHVPAVFNSNGKKIAA